MGGRKSTFQAVYILMSKTSSVSLLWRDRDAGISESSLSRQDGLRTAPNSRAYRGKIRAGQVGTLFAQMRLRRRLRTEGEKNAHFNWKCVGCWVRLLKEETQVPGTEGEGATSPAARQRLRLMRHIGELGADRHHFRSGDPDLRYACVCGGGRPRAAALNAAGMAFSDERNCGRCDAQSRRDCARSDADCWVGGHLSSPDCGGDRSQQAL